MSSRRLDESLEDGDPAVEADTELPEPDLLATPATPPSRAQPAPTAARVSSAPARPQPVPRTPPPSPQASTRSTLLLGVLGAAILGMLALIAFLLMQRTSPPAAQTNAPPPAAGNQAAATQPAATDNTPPRMSLDTFKKLYDDPSQRPVILDVRGAESYAEGHITGAILFPEADIAARVSELPKDKLIVAYCQ